jgi:hypothetical protein
VNKINLLNIRFGRLLVLSECPERKKDNRVMWCCLCDCGKVVNIRSVDLIRKKTKSCGCLSKETATKHGASVNKKRIKLYRVWTSMRARCSNKNLKIYKHYGGRGISICDEFNDFIFFEKWANNNGYKEGLTIDRIDNNGNYCEKNCRWVTQKINSINRRSTIFVNFMGKELSLSDWSRELSGNRNYVGAMRFKTGLSNIEIIKKKYEKNNAVRQGLQR